MTASHGCRKPFLTQRRRLDRKGSDATPTMASQAPHSADVRQPSPKKVSMVSLGCPKNTVDGKRFTLQRHQALLLPWHSASHACAATLCLHLRMPNAWRGRALGVKLPCAPLLGTVGLQYWHMQCMKSSAAELLQISYARATIKIVKWHVGLLQERSCWVICFDLGLT